MISQNRYVDITSGVGAATTVSTRQFTLRLVTQNDAIQPGTIYSFSDADDVMDVFGSTSEEYKRAAAYFGFVSKSISSPAALSFIRWTTVAAAPAVEGDKTAKSLTSLKAVTAGQLNFVINGSSAQVTAIDLSSATDLTTVATLIQTAVRKSSNAMLTTASVTYNTNTNQFTIVGGTAGEGTLTVNDTAGANDIASLLGLSDATASAGVDAQEPVEAVSAAAETNNNFGSFVFCTPNVALTNDQIVALAAWNHAQNNMYLYSLSTVQANAATLYALLQGYSGTALNVSADAADSTFIDQAPAEILAATDYTTTNATQDYMFYQFSARDVAITTDAAADAMDAVRANYIGQTQAAGGKLAFYQRGVLMGGSTAAIDMNTYANEMWLKDYISAAYLTILLSLPKVSANTEGEAQLISVLQSSVDEALDNGVISPGKTLSNVQRLYVTQLTGDKNAWRQIQTNGYWYAVTIASRVNTNSGLTEWYANYLLVYGKDDVIRFVKGRDTLI